VHSAYSCSPWRVGLRIVSEKSRHTSSDHRYNYQLFRNSYMLRAPPPHHHHHHHSEHFQSSVTASSCTWSQPGQSIVFWDASFFSGNKDEFRDVDGCEKSSSLCILRILFSAFCRFFSSSVTLFLAFLPAHSRRTWRYFWFCRCVSSLYSSVSWWQRLNQTKYARLSFNRNRVACSVWCSRWWWNWPMHADGNGVTIPFLSCRIAGS
jgi:hypothetical protein